MCQIALWNHLKLASLVRKKKISLKSYLPFVHKLIPLTPLSSKTFRVLVKASFEIADLPINFWKFR